MGTLVAWPGESESLDGLGMKISCVTASVLSARAVSLRVERERRRVDSMGMSTELMPTNGLMLPQDCLLFAESRCCWRALKGPFKHAFLFPSLCPAGPRAISGPSHCCVKPWVPLPLVESC